MKTKNLSTVFIGVLFLLFFLSANLLKAQDCDTVTVTQNVTEITRDPNNVLVYADWVARRTSCVVNADVAEAGYFKIFMETKNDSDQINESYYLTIKYPDGTFAPLCDPNLSQWKVVPDTVGVNPSGLRYAGSFYFEAGVNQIIINHYAIIAPDYPDFWLGASDSLSIVNGPTNSVHVIRLELDKSTDRFDLALTYSAQTDTSLLINGNLEQVVPMGETYSYTLSVINQGTNSANDVKLWMVPPDSVRLFDFNRENNYTSGDTLFWILNEVAPAQQIIITYQANVATVIPNTPFQLYSESRVEAGCDTDPNNNFAEVAVYVIDPFNYFGADLALAQTAQTDTSLEINGNLERVVPIGDIYSYELNVLNQGPNIAQNVILWILPPDSVNLINFNIPPTSTSGDTIFWTFSQINPAQQINITFEADVADVLPATPFELKLNSRVDYLYDTNPANNTAQNSVLAIDPFNFFGADITLGLAAQTDTNLSINGNMEQAVPVGEIYSYEMKVANQGTNTAQNVKLWIIPPDSVALINFNIPPSSTSGDTIFWNFPNITPAQQIDITFQADVFDVLPVTPYELSLSSNVEYPYDPLPANNSARVSVYAFDPLNIFGADVTLDVSAQTDTSLIINGNQEQVEAIGGTYSYNLKATNQGPNSAQNVTLWIIPPDSVNLLNFNIPPTVAAGDTVFWNFPNLAVAQQIDIIFQAEVVDALPVTPFELELKSQVDYLYDTNPTNNSAHNSVFAIDPFNFFGADINLDVTATTDTSLLINGNLQQAVPVGRIYSYEVNVSNQGPNTAQNVILWMVPPDSVNLINFNLPPNSTSGDTLFWTFPNLTPAQQVDITFQADVANKIPVTPFELELNSNISYRYDPNPANNSAQNSVYAFDPFNIYGADISLVQTVQTDTSLIINGNLEQAEQIGETYSYRLKVRNGGPNAAENVVLWIIPPDSVQLKNFNIPANSSSGDTLFWNFNELTAGQQKDIIFQAEIVDSIPNLPFELLLKSEVDYLYDNNPANNSAQNLVYAVDLFDMFGTDLTFSQSARTDTTIDINGNLEQVEPVGDVYIYELTIGNNGPNPAQDVILWVIPPDSVTLSNFNIPPDSTSGDTLFWIFNQIPINRPVDLIFRAEVADSLPDDPYELIIKSNVIYPFDTDTTNNKAENTVFAIDPIPYFGTDIGLTYTAQTDTSIEVDGKTEQAIAIGGTYTYQLNISNDGPLDVVNVVVWITKPDSVTLFNFNIQPGSVSADTILWKFHQLANSQQKIITFSALVNHALPVEPFKLFSESKAEYKYDTSPQNNSANITVYATDSFQPTPVACDTVSVTQDITEISRDPNELVVIADVILRRSLCAVHVDVTDPGYYQIYVETLYDNDQMNESYYMSVQYPDGRFAPLCDPNLGQWKVVTDTTTNNATEQRNAGSFYFDAGVNKIILNHYANLAADYPDFWVGPADSLSLLATPESVHVVKIVLVKIPDGFDVALSYTAQTDTSITIGNQLEQVVNLGKSYTCELNLINQGNQTASDLLLWITKPGSVEFLNFSIQPAGISADTLFWLFDLLATSQQLTITFDASVAQSLPATPLKLFSESTVNVRCDANLTNNSADVTVFAVDPCDYFVSESPQIEIPNPLVEVGDSASVRIWLPKGVVSWDILVRYVDGTTDQTYADDFISSTPLVENQWIELDPLFTNTRLITAAESEDIIFEIQTTDICDNLSSAQASVTVRSSDDCLLDRNVFQPAGSPYLGIKFKLSTNRNARLDLYDITGYHITKIAEGPFNAGWNIYPWDGRTTEDGHPVGSGVYIVTIRSGKLDCVLKVIIVR